MIFGQGRRSRRRRVNWLKIGAIKELQDSLATFRLVICNSGNSSICCWIFGCISQAVFCLPQGNTSLSSCRVQPKFLFLHLSKGKNVHGYALKIYPFTFSAEKSGVLFLEKQEIYKMFKTAGLSAKRKQAKDGEILCLLQYIFSKQNRAIPFPIILLCYGSNSGVGSYTSIISRAANRNPFVSACSSFRS